MSTRFRVAYKGRTRTLPTYKPHTDPPEPEFDFREWRRKLPEGEHVLRTLEFL